MAPETMVIVLLRDLYLSDSTGGWRESRWIKPRQGKHSHRLCNHWGTPVIVSDQDDISESDAGEKAERPVHIILITHTPAFCMWTFASHPPRGLLFSKRRLGDR
jgi:hypothetical protein